MQKFNKFKKIKKMLLLIGLLLPTAWCGANSLYLADGVSGITIKEGCTQGMPKGNSIHASINGHVLTVFFSENIGPVAIEIFKDSGGNVETHWVETPDGLQTYLPLAGEYLITFTLANGDEYYGEFTVMD